MSGQEDSAENTTYSLILARLGELHEDVSKVHTRIDVLVDRGLLTKEDCEKCQERKHGISPRVALFYTLGGGFMVAIFNKISWINIWHFLKGG